MFNLYHFPTNIKNFQGNMISLEEQNKKQYGNQIATYLHKASDTELKKEPLASAAAQ